VGDHREASRLPVGAGGGADRLGVGRGEGEPAGAEVAERGVDGAGGREGVGAGQRAQAIEQRRIGGEGAEVADRGVGERRSMPSAPPGSPASVSRRAKWIVSARGAMR
jgi:hypothetical protein